MKKILFILLAFCGVLNAQVYRIGGNDTVYYDGTLQSQAYRLGSVYQDADTIATYFNTYFTGVPDTAALNPSPTFSRNIRSNVLVSGTYHIFSEEFSTVWYILKNTSTTGTSWGTSSSALLAAGSAGQFDQGGQADPTVIYDGAGDWKMWYDATKGADTAWTLGYATSTDGTTWTKYGQILTRGTTATGDKSGLHHPACIKYDGTYYLFYSASNTDALGRGNIHLATSTDGINWTKYSGNPILSKGTTGTFDDVYLRPSEPIFIHDTWYMWYWSYDGANHQMGLATSKDLYNWTKKGQVLTGSGITASTAIKKEGTNPKDVMLKQWYFSWPSNGVMFNTIAVPNEFTKLYNWSSFDFPTYGDATYSSGAVDKSANYIYFQRITVSANFTPNCIQIYIYPQSKPTSGKIKLALYANGTNTPGALVATTEERDWSTITGTAWNKFNFTVNPNLTAVDYWIAIWSDAGIYYTKRVAGGSNNWGNLSRAYGAWPDPVTATTTFAFSDVDTYITYYNANTYRVPLVTEPTKVYFNNILGTKKLTRAAVTAEYDWYWSDNVLTIYSDESPDFRYQISYE
jgi:predicted GH43/DUF377 family glycosyl hydrolase